MTEKAYEEEQKNFKDKEHRELVSRNTSICFDESRMEEWTFKNADMSDVVMHKAKNYVDNWDEMKRNHIGCLFWGCWYREKLYCRVYCQCAS